MTPPAIIGPGQLDQLVAAIPPKLRKTVIAVLLSILGYVAWSDWRPEVVVAPVQAQVTELKRRLDTDIAPQLDKMQRRLEDGDRRFDRGDRFACLQNRRNAVAAGMPCGQLLGESR